MRVLLLTQYYYPEPVEKVHDLARGLVRLGHHVEVITGFPCYPSGEIYPGYRQRLVAREVIDGVRVMRIPQLPDHSTSALRRAAYYLSFMFSSAVAGLLHRTRADVIFVYQAALPVGISGWLLAGVKRLPYVVDVVDLWPESVASSGMLRSRLAETIIRATAKFIYMRAAAVSAVTQGFRANLVARGVDPQKVSVINNWMPEETYRRADYDAEIARKEGLEGKFNVMYGGNVGASQGLDTVVEAAELLRDENSVQFVIVGGGTELDRLVAAAGDRGLTNIRFLGRRDPEEMPALYAIADVLLVHLKPDALTEITIPSKTFAYMTVGKPVIMAVGGEATRFVLSERFGVSVPPSDPAALADAVRRLLAAPGTRAEMGEAALRAHQSKYSSRIQIARMADLLASVVRGAPS